MKTLQRGFAVLLAVLFVFSFAALPASAVGEGLHYVVLGDSIAAGSGLRNPNEASYGRIVANTNGYSYQNFGHDGDRTSALLSKLDNGDVANAVRRANIISISIGGNDFFTNNSPGLFFEVMFGYHGRINSIASDMRRNFAGIIEKIKRYNPNAVILMQTLYNPTIYPFRFGVEEAVKRVNSMIYDYLNDHPGAYHIVDVKSAIGADPTYICIDTIHPNAKGNERIAKVILQKLYDLGLGSRTDPVIRVKGVSTGEIDFAAIGAWFSRLGSFFTR